ncbi:hypothetical protein HYN56_21090 [Flavobacterium crocinum]|uniref:Uncharacterized protein n=1 Tax=Flavobacterium crocinum TaxID=2183896 RepID=A0A2S1YS27_9FLAO|nr:hypothetical protein [Flavobacterium crocinum]AWK06588.1 hypothetical protein HYN56_21090 [Flavobacterium crocinum]
MKSYYKISVTILCFFLLVTIWNYFKKPISIKEERATNVPIKFSADLNEDWQKVINVYIPYKIEVKNNRLKMIRLNSFDDGNSGNVTCLTYNTAGFELSYLYYNEYSDLYYDEYKESFNNLQLKYRASIFPFFSRTFYYYKRHQFIEGKLHCKFNFSKLDYDDYNEQFKFLSKTLNIPINKKIIDSLYKTDENKRFNIYFYDNRNLGMPMFIETRFNSAEQIYIDVFDTIKNMNREQMEKYYRTNFTKRIDLKNKK